LARLDVQDIELDLLGVTAERTSALLDQESARAAGNAAALRTAELEVARLDARIAYLQHQKAQGLLVAPIAGVVILGDLEGRVGASVRAGQDLLEIAGTTALYLELSIPETEIGKFAAGDTGVFRPDFDPSLRFDAVAEALSPALDLTGPVPLAQAKAQFAAPDAQEAQGAQGAESAPVPHEALRPGVRGVMLIGSQDTPIWQVLYTSLRDWVLLRFWL